MTNKRENIKTMAGSIALVIMVMFFTGHANAQNLPEPVDFQKVVIGTTDTYQILFDNSDSDNEMGVIVMLKDGTGPFSLDGSYINITVAGRSSANVPVHFCPSEENAYSDALNIYFNLSPAGEVAVTGEGTSEIVESHNPIAPLLACYNGMVEDGRIKGRGHGKRAQRRLAAFTKMVERAYLAVDQEKIDRAYYQLKVADKQIKRTLKGDGISELTKEVEETMNSLGYEEKKARSRWHNKMKQKYSAYKKSCRK